MDGLYDELLNLEERLLMHAHSGEGSMFDEFDVQEWRERAEVIKRKLKIDYEKI